MDIKKIVSYSALLAFIAIAIYLNPNLIIPGRHDVLKINYVDENGNSLIGSKYNYEDFNIWHIIEGEKVHYVSDEMDKYPGMLAVVLNSSHKGHTTTIIQHHGKIDVIVAEMKITNQQPVCREASYNDSLVYRVFGNRIIDIKE
jgi:hypothetical protein